MTRLVVFSGAGMSAESGISTFRDSNGLWENYDIQQVATPEAWNKDPALVQRFYNERRKNILEAKPNQAHQYIAKLQAHLMYRLLRKILMIYMSVLVATASCICMVIFD